MREICWTTLLVACAAAGSCTSGKSTSPAATGAAGSAVVAPAQPGVAGATVAGGVAGTGSAAPASGGGAAVAGSSASAAAGGSGVAGAAGAAGQAGGSALDAGTHPAADAGAGPAPDTCDRACLIAIVGSYLDALAAKSSTSLKTSASLKYTENGVATQLGQGLWMTASKLEADTRLDFADPVAGQVTSQLVVDENGSTPVLYQVRLKVVKHEITEIESMSVRQQDAANGFFDVTGMKPDPIFNKPIDLSQRMTRDQLKSVVDLYIGYLDGKTGGDGVPFDTNCVRTENGVATASGIASFQLQSWGFDVVARYLVFDEEYGIVWGMFPFSQDATALVVGEAFKVIGGKIMMIRAVMANMPAKAWD
jgi:hypothetical protein